MPLPKPKSDPVADRMARFMEDRVAVTGSCTNDDLAQEFTTAEIIEHVERAKVIALANRAFA